MNIYKFSKLFRESANWFDYGHSYKEKCPVILWVLTKSGYFREKTLVSEEDFDNGSHNDIGYGRGDTVAAGRFEKCTKTTSAILAYTEIEGTERESLKAWANERLREKFGQITIMWKNSFVEDWQKM